MKVTQGDIAKRLKLSVTTVSRALQNDPVINPETRAEVMEMASKLGYQPKSGRVRAQAENNDHHYIAVLIKEPISADSWAPDHVAHGYLSGMSEVSRQFNCSLLIHHVNDNNVHELLDDQLAPPFIRDKTISGFILIHYFQPEIVEALQTKFPAVSIVHDIPHLNIDHIDVDNYNSVDLLVKHLHEKGHRQIGFMGFRPNMSWSQARLGGYLQALVKLDLDIDRDNIIGELDLDFVLAKKSEGVTAWICSVDRIAYALYRQLLDAGVNVPEEIAICGFDGVEPLLNCPQITTAKPPHKQMGIAALHRLLIRLDEPLARSLKILHRSEIILGEST